MQSLKEKAKETAKRVLGLDEPGEESTVSELSEIEQEKAKLQTLKEIAAEVVAKGHVTLSKAEMGKLVIGDRLEQMENQMDAAAANANLRRYNLLAPQKQRLAQTKATVEDLGMETEILVVEADNIVMVQESLLDCVDVQEKFLETASKFNELAQSHRSLLDRYETNCAKIGPARKNIEATMSRIRSVNEVTRRLEEPVSSAVLLQYKEHRKRLGLPP